MVYAGKQRLLRKQTRPLNVLTQMLMNVKSTFSNLEHEYVEKLAKDLADEKAAGLPKVKRFKTVA
jgi:hypothetical protein